jgi:hypothetical protein
MTHPVGLVVLHLDALVLLGVEPDLFRTCLVFKAQGIGVGVGATAALAGRVVYDRRFNNMQSP